MKMSSTFKGLYSFCINCVYRKENIRSRYPCIQSHKAVRKSANVKYERDFKMCGLKKEKMLNKTLVRNY